MMHPILKAWISAALKFVSRPAEKLHRIWVHCCLQVIPGLELHEDLRLEGLPLIEIAPGAKVVVENGVTLNSRNREYHLNLHSPVKLVADRPGAMIRIGAGTRLHGSCVHAFVSVEIGRNCLIAANCQIIDGNGHELSFEDIENRIHTTGVGDPIVIEDGVWIGANCIILPGVRIGRGSVIAAGSVVTREIPSMVVAGGNPARVIRTASEAISRRTAGG